MEALDADLSSVDMAKASLHPQLNIKLVHLNYSKGNHCWLWVWQVRHITCVLQASWVRPRLCIVH